jgi:hypothetical protein
MSFEVQSNEYDRVIDTHSLPRHNAFKALPAPEGGGTSNAS